MNHSALSWRDLLWLSGGFSLSGASSAALAVAVVSDSRTLLDLPWLVITGAVGLAMFGGLVGTLFVVHAASITGDRVNIQTQVLTDLGRAAILGLVTYAVVVVQGWQPEVLLGLLPLLGVAGQKILDPILRGLVSVATTFSDRLLGKTVPKE